MSALHSDSSGPAVPDSAAFREEIRSFSKISKSSSRDANDGSRLKEKEASKAYKKKQAARRIVKLINMEAADKRSLSNMMNSRGFQIVAPPSPDDSGSFYGSNAMAGNTVNEWDRVSNRSSRRPSTCSQTQLPIQPRRPSNFSQTLGDWSTDAPSVLPSPRQSFRKDQYTATVPDMSSIEEALQALQSTTAGPQLPEDQSFMRRVRGFAIHIIASDRFNFLIGILIIVSMILMGIELDTDGTGSDVMFSLLVVPHVPEQVFSFFELLFFIIFGSELFLRVLAEPGFAARAGSTYVDAAALCPYVLQILFNLQDGRHFVLLRVVRLLRLCRVSRLIRVFKELRFLVKSIISAMQTLVWIGLLLFILVYCAAIFCTTMIGQNTDFEKSNNLIQRYEAAHGVEADVERNWGNTSRSMLTLFQIFTLDDWGQFVRPVLETHQPWMIVFFVMFIFLTTFGLLNLLMGAIVDHTMSVHRQAALDRERLLEEEYKQTMLAAARLFTLIDSEKKGTISAEELDEFLRENDIRDALEAELKQFNLSIDYDMLGDAWSDAAAVFNTMHDEFDGEDSDQDEDQPRGICMEEFVGLAMRLQGQARSKDVLATLIEAKAAVLRILQVDESLDDLHRKVDAQGRRMEESVRLLKNLDSGCCDHRRQATSGSDDDAVSRRSNSRTSGIFQSGPNTRCSTKSFSEIDRPNRASISVSLVQDMSEVRGSQILSKEAYQFTRSDSLHSAAAKLLGEGGCVSQPLPKRYKKRASGAARSRSNSSSDQEVTNLAIPATPSRAASRHNSINRRPSMADREMLAAGATRQLAATLKSINKDATFAAMETTKVLNSYSELNHSEKPQQRQARKKGNSMTGPQPAGSLFSLGHGGRDSLASQPSVETQAATRLSLGEASRRMRRNLTGDMSQMSDSIFRSLAMVRDTAAALNGSSSATEKPSVSVNGPSDDGNAKENSSASSSAAKSSAEVGQFGPLPNFVIPG